MTRRFVRVAVLAAMMAGAASLCRSQTSSELNTYFQQNVGLTQDQVAATTRRVGFKPNYPSLPRATTQSIQVSGRWRG
jgi:hypothetical protein